MPAEYAEAEAVFGRYLQLKQLCGHTGGLQLILELGADLAPWEAFNKRWTGEKLFGVQLDVGVFVLNQKGFPVLARAHQETVKALMKQNVNFILRGKHPNDDLDHYYQYLCHLFK